MNLLAPLNLLWLLPIGGLIVVMYILKLRRKDVVVSSTFLWSQVIRDVQANAPFQKLRKNLLLFLQLLIAAFLIFALARPILRLAGIGGRNIVLIVDTSASMGATDVSPTRLEQAKRKAKDRIADLRPGDRMMLLSAFSRPQAVTGFTDDRTELRRAVEGLTVHETGTKMREALSLAADLVAARGPGQVGRIELISDGAFEENTAVSGGKKEAVAPAVSLAGLNLGTTHLEYFPIGAGQDNVGITAVDFRRNPGSEKTVQLLVVTKNFSDKARKFTEEVYAEDNLVEAHEVTLAPGTEDTQPYDLPEPENPLLMRVKLDTQDTLTADNTAFLLLKPRKVLKTLLVGKENLFLENALKVDPAIDLSRAPAYNDARGYDVVIFNDAAPSKLPSGNYIFLHCTSDQSPVKVAGETENVGAADWEREHPALRYVDLGNDRFGKALNAVPLGWGKEIAVAESGSLIATGEREGKRSLFVAFSLNESLFPLRVSFPIFLSNSVRWVGTGSDDSEIGQVRTGSPFSIPAPAGIGSVTVTRPDGSRRTLVVGERGGTVFNEVDALGLYTVEGKDFTYRFVANLADTVESDILPRKTLTITENPTGSEGRRVIENRELLPLLIVLSLLILGVEWWAFHRRVFVH